MSSIEREARRTKGGGKSVREIDKEGSRLLGRVQDGTGSPCFPTGIAALLLQYR